MKQITKIDKDAPRSFTFVFGDAELIITYKDQFVVKAMLDDKNDVVCYDFHNMRKFGSICNVVFDILTDKHPDLIFKKGSKEFPHRNGKFVKMMNLKMTSFFDSRFIMTLEKKIPGITQTYWDWYKGSRQKVRNEIGSKLLQSIPKIIENPYLLTDISKYKMLREYLLSGLHELNTNWRDRMFSRSGYDYESVQVFHLPINRRVLNKTIDTWKWCFKIKDLGESALVYIDKPLDNRTKLYLLNQINQYSISNHPNRYSQLIRIINNSPAKDIRKAFKIYKKHVAMPSYSLKKLTNCGDFSRFLSDFINDVEYNGSNIVGLTKRSIEWHEEFLHNTRTRNAQRFLQNRDPLTKTKTPPIEVKIEGIKFIDTLQGLIDEGERMGHCVATYGDAAINGSSYIYHVEYEKEMATVELRAAPQYNDNGICGHILTVNQSKGPRNCENKASKYAENEFKRLLRKVNKNVTNIGIVKDRVDINRNEPAIF